MSNLQKLIEGYPNYYINENGDVWNNKKKKFLKRMINRGYNQIILCKHSKHKTFKPHRLVALAFIPNPDNKPEINHKDGNKLNNHVSNLEWCTRSENSLHRYRVLKIKVSDKMRTQARINGLAIGGKNKHLFCKVVLNTETGIYYDSIKEAAMSANLRHNYLSRMLSGDRKNKTAFILA